MASTTEQPVSSPPSWWQRICRWLWRVMVFLWGTAIVGIVTSVLATVFTTTTDTPLSKLLVVHWALAYPIPVISAAGVFLVLTIASWIGSREDKATLSLSPDQQSRTNILKSLRKS